MQIGHLKEAPNFKERIPAPSPVIINVCYSIMMINSCWTQCGSPCVKLVHCACIEQAEPILKSVYYPDCSNYSFIYIPTMTKVFFIPARHLCVPQFRPPSLTIPQQRTQTHIKSTNCKKTSGLASVFPYTVKKLLALSAGSANQSSRRQRSKRPRRAVVTIRGAS